MGRPGWNPALHWRRSEGPGSHELGTIRRARPHQINDNDPNCQLGGAGLIGLAFESVQGRDDRVLIIGKVYLSFLALWLGGLGVYLFARRVRLLLTGVRVKAEFVGWRHSGRHRFPVVAFMAEDGRRHEFAGGVGRINPVARATYPVIYARRDPRYALISSPFALWAPSAAMLTLCAGAVLALVNS